MNILIVVNHLNIGGITSYAFSLGCALKKMGHKVFIGSSAGSSQDKFSAAGLTRINLPLDTKQEIGPGVLRAALHMKDISREFKIDIIHANSRTTAVAAWCCGKFGGAPYISTCHGYFQRRPLRRLWPCWGRHIIAISDEVRKHLENDWKVRPQLISVINNGIDAAYFSKRDEAGRLKIRGGLGLKEDDPLIGIVARLSEDKGLVYLIEAMQEIVKGVPQAQLLIVGDGKLQEELVSLTVRLKLEQCVHFMPAVKDTLAVLSSLDIFVMPSVREGLGLALMEAMAAGLAVIGSEVGGIKNLLKDGVNGCLVRPRDPQAIAAAVRMLINHPQARRALGAQAAADMRQNYSCADMALKTERVYQGCLG